MNAYTMGLRSVAQRERKINHPELGGILDGAADEIERLRMERQYALDVVDAAKGEIERLLAAERAAYKAGFWEWAGPTNEQEIARYEKDEQEGWEGYVAKRSHQQTTRKEG